MFLLIDNYDSFTYNLAQAFQSLGKDPLVLKNDEPALLELTENPDLEMVCISPGPGHPADAGLCLQFLKKLPPHVPVLGICLGHQILGLYGGGEIEIAPVIMHGKQSQIEHTCQGMFESLPSPLQVGRYHSLIVKETENCAFEVTSRGPQNEIMGLKYKDRPWAGAQFHPESVLTPDGLRFLANFPHSLLPKAEIPFKEILGCLSQKKDLSPQMASQAFSALMDGELAPAQAGAFLLGLHSKGETAGEIAEAIKAALKRANRVENLPSGSLDIVGTGGDGKNSFNCSTAAALTLAGMGYKIAKHGNRAVSSTSGAADALEGLGLSFPQDPVSALEQIEKSNFTFLFAPYFHPGFKNIGPIRKDLGIPTLFNILGPMINPGRPDFLVMGVANQALVPIIAEALRLSGIKRAAIFTGAGGYDEVTAMGITRVLVLKNGEISELIIDPSRYGMKAPVPEELACATKKEALEALEKIISGNGTQAMTDMVILNVALAIYLLEDLDDFDKAVARAESAVRAGAGKKALENAR